MEINLNCHDFIIKIDKKEVIKNLFDFKVGSALTEIVSVERSNEMKAFILLFNTSRATNVQLAKAYGQDIINKTYNLVAFTKNSESEYRDFLTQNVVIKKDFFQNVLQHDNTYLISSFNLFEKFCSEVGISLPPEIRSIYYIDFRENLSLEYQNNKESYGELVKFFDNPIKLENDKFAKLLDKYSTYKKFFTTPLQRETDSSETLEDLYIKPNFSVYKNNLINVGKEGSGYFENLKDNPNIHEFFEQYFLISNKNEHLKENYDMVFVLGQPGQGKTSFCYKLLYDYLQNNNDLPPIPIIFIKIRDLVASDFVRAPFEEIGKHFTYINFDSDELIVILDGLDEAYMSGGISDSDLRNLYDRLKRRPNKKIKIILTSRFNYLSVTDSCLDNTLVLQLNELTDSQIIEYCANFGTFYPESFLSKDAVKIVNEGRFSHIKELLRQAVLTYFVGISNISIDDKDSKSKIYDKIFDAMAQRSWDKTYGQLDYINPGMRDKPEKYKKYLREYLCNLAFEIYQSPNLYITVRELVDLPSTKTFIQKCFHASLFESPEKIKEINKYLLISFYFQESKSENYGDTAIEFFHNSLFEYLTAEYFWNENKKFLLKRDDDDDLQNFNYAEYFTLLNKLVGNKNISDTIEYNLIEIIENEDYAIKKDIIQQSEKLFNDALNQDFLITFNRKENKLTAREKIHQLFRLFWIYLHTSNSYLDEIYTLPEKVEIYFSEALTFLDSFINMEIREGNYFSRIYFHESFVKNSKFTDCSLNIDFYETLIENCFFEEVDFHESSLGLSTFKNTEFINSRFPYGINAIHKTKFINCTFYNVYVPNEAWFTNFLEQNEFDEDMLKRLYLEERIEKDYKDTEETNYYIMMEEE